MAETEQPQTVPTAPEKPVPERPFRDMKELLEILPRWQGTLHALTSRFPDTGAVTAVAPGPIELNLKKKNKEDKTQPRPSTPPANKQAEVGNKKLHQKPGGTKAKFSQITGPDILYDGESQTTLFTCWTAMNTHRGQLRKEMMQIKRKKVMVLPSTTDYGYEESDDEIEADSDAEEQESEEAKAARLEEEKRRQAEEKEKAEAIKRMAVLLEEVDNCLDKAARACENAAFLWLKGEGCAGHIVYINDILDEAVGVIAHEFRPTGEDEGFGSEIETPGEEAEVELPHKKPARPVPDPDPVAGTPRRTRAE